MLSRTPTWFLILSHDYPKGLELVLSSIESTGYSLDYTKIILDNVDEEKYVDVLSKYKDKVDWVFSWPNELGYYRSYNNAIMSIPATDYFVTINDDIEFLGKGWLEYLHSYMNELVGMVGLEQDYITESGIKKTDRMRISSCCLMNPEAVRKTGLYDEKYWMCYGDIEYILRMHSRGYKIVGVKTDLISHERSHTLKPIEIIQKRNFITDAWNFYQQLSVIDYEWNRRFLNFSIQSIKESIKDLIKWRLDTYGI